VPAILSRNWRLKLLALGLAVFAWTVVVYAGNPPDSRTVTVPVPQDASSLSGKFVLASKIPDLAVRVQGTKDHVDQFDPSDLQVIVDYRSIQSPGRQQIPVTIVNNDRDVDLDNPPSSVSADVDVIDSRTVPVSIVLKPGPPRGYTVVGQAVTPAQLTVDGPAHQLGGVQARVEVDLTNRKIPLDQTLTVKFVGPDGQPETNLGVSPPDTTTVTVHIDIRSAVITRVSAVAPILPTGLVAPGHYLTGITQDPLTVVLTGPEDLLNGLDSVTTTPLAQLSLTGDTDETVRLVLPAGVTADHATVTVHVRIAGIPPPPTSTPAPPTATPTPGSTPTATPSPTPAGSPTPTPTPKPTP